MPENWCWEGPTELYGEWHGHRKDWRIGIIIGNISEKSMVVVMREHKAENCFQRLSRLGIPYPNYPCGLPAMSRPASTSASPALRIAPFPGTDYSDWKIGKSSFWYLMPFCFLFWSWFWHVGFRSSSHSHNWGECTGPVVLVSQSLSKPSVGE